MADLDVVVLDRMRPGEEEQELVRQLTARSLAAEVIDFQRLSFEDWPARVLLDGEPFTAPKVAIIRSRVLTRHTEGDVALLYDWLEMFESFGVTLINTAKSIRLTQNKVYSLSLLARAGIPIPATRSVRTIGEIDRCVADWKHVVLKPIFGHSSVDLVRIRAMPSDEDAIDEEILSWHLLRRHHVLCAQRFIPNPGRDLRVVVLQGRVVSFTYRIARSPTKRVHDHLYPYAQEPAPFQPDVESYAVRSCAVLGLDCAAIDMVEGPDGVVILEVNPTVSIWRRLDQEGHHLTTGGIASSFVDMVIDAVNRNAGSNAGSPRSI